MAKGWYQDANAKGQVEGRRSQHQSKETRLGPEMQGGLSDSLHGPRDKQGCESSEVERRGLHRQHALPSLHPSSCPTLTCPPPHRKNPQEPHLYFPSCKQNQSFHSQKKKKEEKEEERRRRRRRGRRRRRRKVFCLGGILKRGKLALSPLGFPVWSVPS